jgi:dihydroorotate dehydrogenase
VIQIYSGLIYEGPQLIKDCINALKPWSRPLRPYNPWM